MLWDYTLLIKGQKKREKFLKQLVFMSCSYKLKENKKEERAEQVRERERERFHVYEH